LRQGVQAEILLSLALADETERRGVAPVQSGAPWSPIRIASCDPEPEGVIPGRIDGPLSGLFLVGLVLADVLVFGLFGVWLMRRRVAGPLGRLSRAVQELGEGDAPTDVLTEGAREIAEPGRAFNEMQVALASRRRALLLRAAHRGDRLEPGLP
jgi:HAMP domain-containing protein